MVMPLAFICANKGFSDSDYRLKLVDEFYKNEALDIVIDTFKEAIDECS